ncbi:MAG: alpha/beta hydrolase [Hyphomicrobiaceae bacterium]
MLRAIATGLMALVVGLASQISGVVAQSGGTTRIYLMAAQTVPAGATSVRIDLSRYPGSVRGLRVVAREGTAVIERMMITYTSGQMHYEDRENRINLAPGERTAEIDPRDIGRFVEQIELKLQPADRVMRLEIWAVQGDAERSARRETSERFRQITTGPVSGSPATPAPEATTPRDSKAPAKTRTVRRAATDSGERYSQVEVYYGTNRKPEADRKIDGRTLATYGSTPDRQLALGRAIVTVPTEGRVKGVVNRPEWDLIVASIALRGQDPTRDFTLLTVDQMSRQVFAARAREQLGKASTFRGHALVFVHGYNVSFDDALFRAAQITFDTEFDGLPLVFAWPSLGGVRGYFLDQRRARTSGEAMREFLDMVAAETGAEKIHLIAHSMGANPILEALLAYASPVGTANQPRFSEIILAAPDILRDDFERISSRIKGLARGVTLFASSNDRALQLSNFATLGVSPAGYVPGNAPPVIVDGVDTIDVSALNTGVFGLNHSTFADREALIGDIRALISDATRRRPNERQPRYTPIPVSPASTYWKYAN